MPATLDPLAALRAAGQVFASRTPDGAWRSEARAEQLPPEPPDWFMWLILAGRAWGKTWTGARWLADRATATAGDYAVIGRTEDDTRATCIEGRSGLLAALNIDRASRSYKRSTRQIELPNGSVIHAYSAEKLERTRGPNFRAMWADELASWRFAAETWTEVVLPSIRIGDASSDVQVVVTTTPKPVPLLRDFISRSDGSVVITKGSTFDNEANLSPRAIAEFRRLVGSRIGRQELLGELLDDVEGALWQRALIERHRVASIHRSALRRVVVGVDPAVTSHAKSDHTGIIVAGLDNAGQAYVLDDLTCKATPDQWARRVAAAFYEWDADRIVVEKDHGYDLLESVLRTVDPTLPLKMKNAGDGKIARAEPVAASYEQGKVHHVGALVELEYQMCTWDPRQTRDSPDRVDALVHAITELQPGRSATIGAPMFGHRDAWHSALTERASV